jgi:epoxyqueuosine reductase QueG
MGNARDAAHRPVLERLANDDDPVVREHAAWALQRLQAASEGSAPGEP